MGVVAQEELLQGLPAGLLFDFKQQLQTLAFDLDRLVAQDGLIACVLQRRGDRTDIAS